MVKIIISLPGIFAGCLMAIVLNACSETKQVEQSPRPVRVTPVRYQNALTTVHYSGEVKVRHESPLSFQVPGKISKRLADVGDSVRKGQLLASLEPFDYQLRENDAKAKLLAAQAELDQARKDMQHLGNLLEKQLSTPASLERRKNAVKASEARVSEAQALLALSSRKFAYTELRAQHDGVITAVEAETEQVVSPRQTIYRLGRMDEKEVVINVPENRLDDLRSATTIRVSLWAKPAVFHTARVREISPGADALIRTFTVRVAILDNSDEVRMGMTATVHVERNGPRPVARLPLTAVTQSDRQPAVWIVDSSNQSVHPRTVTLDGYEDENAKILDGIDPGELVVTAGVHKLLPGQRVRILDEKKQ